MDEVEEEENEDSTSITFERSIIQIFGFSLTFGFSLEQMEHDRCWFLFENVHALQTHVVMSNVLTKNTRSTRYKLLECQQTFVCFIVLLS